MFVGSLAILPISLAQFLTPVWEKDTGSEVDDDGVNGVNGC